MARAAVASLPPEDVQRQEEHAAADPVVQGRDEDAGDEEPDRDDDSLPLRIVRERRGCPRRECQGDAREERDRRHDLVTGLGRLA